MAPATTVSRPGHGIFAWHEWVTLDSYSRHGPERAEGRRSHVESVLQGVRSIAASRTPGLERHKQGVSKPKVRVAAGARSSDSTAVNLFSYFRIA